MAIADINTKERIQNKADELFMKYGIRSVSMDDIANALGMSKKTIYQYFSDKNELVDAVVDKEIQEMQQDCARFRDGSKNAIEEIILSLDDFVEQFRNINPIVVHDLEKFHFRSHQRFMEHKNKYLFEIFRDNIERGIKEGLFREEIDMEVLSKFRLESLMLPFNLDIFPPGKFNLADVCKEITEHWLFGLASLKGYKLILKYKEERIKAKHYDSLPGSKAK